MREVTKIYKISQKIFVIYKILLYLCTQIKQ